MTLTEFLAVFGQIVIVLGTLIFASAGLGLIRFTDTYMRISAVGTAGGIGIIMVVSGALLQAPTVADVVKVVIIVVLQLGTSAVGTMVVARAAYLTGVGMSPGYFDELAQDDTSNTTTNLPTVTPTGDELRAEED